MNSLDEMHLIKRQFNDLLLGCNNIEKLDILSEMIYSPIQNIIDSMNEFRLQINKSYSDDVIQELNKSLDKQFVKIKNLKNKLRENKEEFDHEYLDYTVVRYNKTKETFDRITVQRRELQSKYGFLKHLLPKVKKIYSTLHNKIELKKLDIIV